MIQFLPFLHCNLFFRWILLFAFIWVRNTLCFLNLSFMTIQKNIFFITFRHLMRIHQWFFINLLKLNRQVSIILPNQIVIFKAHTLKSSITTMAIIHFNLWLIFHGFVWLLDVFYLWKTTIIKYYFRFRLYNLLLFVIDALFNGKVSLKGRIFNFAFFRHDIYVFFVTDGWLF